MRGRISATFLFLGAFGLAASAGDRLLPDIEQHLDLARKCVLSGHPGGAVAHSMIVIPDHLIRIRVECDRMPLANQGLCRNALSGAMSLWSEALGQAAFVVVESGPSDVTVSFQSGVNSQGSEVAGHTIWTRGVLQPDTVPVVVMSANVQISTCRPGGQSMDFNQMRACAAHELGHVLGLDDCSKVGDIMGPMNLSRPVMMIRPEEISRLVEARKEAQEIRLNFALPARVVRKV